MKPIILRILLKFRPDYPLLSHRDHPNKTELVQVSRLLFWVGNVDMLRGKGNQTERKVESLNICCSESGKKNSEPARGALC